MSVIAISGNASGTGVFTIASPATNTNRTLTLPDAAGTVLFTDGAGAVADIKSINSAPLLHQNDIINGDFRIAQAGTSFAAPADGAYDLDGWLNGNTTAVAVFTVEQVAGSTAGRLARQVTITTADATVDAGDVVNDSTRTEGYNIEKYVGQTFTVAFRAKVPVAGIHCVALRNIDGAAADMRSYVKEINFPTANVWQDCSFTVVGGLPTAGVWNYTAGVGLQITFAHMCGTTYQTTPDAWNTGNFLATANQVNDCATVGNVWAMEKVTLNLGTVAAVSEISVEQELVRCQRYFYRTVTPFLRGVFASATTVGRAGISHPCVMRAVPTITLFGTMDIFSGGASGTINSVSSTYATTHGFEIDAAVATGSFVPADPCVFYIGSNSGGFNVSARL